MRSTSSAVAGPPAIPAALAALLIATLLMGLSLVRPGGATDAATEATRHIVVLDGSVGADGSFQVGGSDVLNLAAAQQVVTAAGSLGRHT